MASDEPQFRYWLDQLIEQVISLHPSGDIVVSSGISPSGPYHVGHAREILTADSIKRVLEENGRVARHLHFSDCHDPLRKRYPYLPESYEQEAGKPLYLIPAPDGKSQSYAHQYFAEYEQSAKKLGVEMEVMWTQDLYAAGKYSSLITTSIQKRDQIAEILKKVSGRTVEEDWLPIQILDETNQSLRTAKFVGFDAQTGLINYLGSDEKEHTADIAKGQVKLDWRIDWPARWKLYGVQVEGFGREHATKGGSYDTGKAIVEEIFGGTAPIPVPYEMINLKGDTKKMSSSLGNLVTLAEGLTIIPPEILRYFTFKSRPERQIFFDPGVGLYALIDEYAKTESETLAGEQPEFKRAWQVASLQGKEHVVSTVPFSHLVMSYQTAQGNVDSVFEILERTGHGEAVKTQPESIRRELEYVDRWLDRFAPDSVKFEIQKMVPNVEPNKVQQDFLTKLITAIGRVAFEPEVIHQAVYASAVESSLKPAEAFKLVYTLFLAKDHGPKVGFFLSSLDKDFVLKRLRREA